MGADEWRERGRIVGPAGRRLFVVDAGGGEEGTVLLLHGFPAGSWSWHRVIPLLPPGFRVLAPDFLGFGHSDKPVGADYSIPARADRLENLLDTLRAGPVHVLAHAYGTSVAQELLGRQAWDEAGERGIRPRSVTFVNGGLFPEANRPFPLQRWLSGWAGRLAAPLLPLGRPFFHRGLARSFGAARPPSEEELEACWRLFSQRLRGDVVASILRYPVERRERRDRLVRALREADVPLRFVVAPDDPVSGAQAGAWRRTLGEEGIVELRSGIGHHPPLEDPEGVVRAWTDFVEGV